MSPLNGIANSGKKFKCRRHEIEERIKRGSITLEIRRFQPTSVQKIGSPYCPICLHDNCTKRKHEESNHFFQKAGTQILAVPTPISYEDLQQHISRTAPSIFAMIERLDGSPILPCQTFKQGDVVVVREIRPEREHEHFDHTLALEYGCDHNWEHEYRKLLQSIE